MNSQDRSHLTTLLLCALLHAFTHAYMVLLLPLILQLQRGFGLESVSDATFLRTVQGMTYCFACLPAGFVADKISRRAALAIGLLLNGLAFVLLSQCQTYSMALAMLAFAGLAGGLYHPAANALLVGLYPDRPGRAIGLVGMGAAAGFAFAPWFAGLRGEACGWRQPCLELGIAGMVVAVIFWFVAERPVATRHDASPTHCKTTTGFVLLAFLLISLAFSLRDFGASGVQWLGTIFLQKVHLLSEKQTGTYFALMGLTALIANPLFGILSDRRRLTVATGVLVAAGVSAAAVPWVLRQYVIAPFLVHTFFILGSIPVVEAALAESVPDRYRGRVLGLFITVSGMIGSTAPWAMGHVAHALGSRVGERAAYAAPFLMLGLSVIAAAVGLIVLRAFRRKTALAQPESTS